MSLPIAIEINESLTRIADVRYQNGVVFLQALGSTVTTPSYFATAENEVIQQKQAQIIHTLTTDLKLTNRQANIVIPDSVTYASIIETPILAEKDLVTAIRYQADEFIPMNVDETYLDLEVLKQDDALNKLSILIVAAPKRMVDGIYKMVELAGLEPNRLETEISAVGRLVSEVMRTRDLKEGYCVLNLGFSGSSIYVVDNATHTLVFNRSCKVGFDLIQRELMMNLNISNDEALKLLMDPGERRAQVVQAISASLHELAQEVARIVDVYVRKYNFPVTHIFTLNFTSYIPDFGRLMSEMTEFRVESLPLNTVYAPNPVLQAFSTEITGFASAVSSSLL